MSTTEEFLFKMYISDNTCTKKYADKCLQEGKKGNIFTVWYDKDKASIIKSFSISVTCGPDDGDKIIMSLIDDAERLGLIVKDSSISDEVLQYFKLTSRKISEENINLREKYLRKVYTDDVVQKISEISFSK